jgi:hypothetical protein
VISTCSAVMPVLAELLRDEVPPAMASFSRRV